MTIDTAATAPNDFDFEIGSWRVKHLRLKERLVGCTEWVEFFGDSSTQKILGGRNPGTLDVPVVGQFANGKGVFFADDVLNGKPIKVRFTWSTPNSDQPLWEQAFSADAGATWETNWTMTFTRCGQ
jgi:hypothetical protein